MGKEEINAFLGIGTSYEGRLQFQGAVRIDGEFKGQIDSEGTLVVGREARIDGRVCVANLIMSGQVQGEIVAAGKVLMHKNARLRGSLRTPCLVVEEGAVLDAEVSMGGGGGDPGGRGGNGFSEGS